MPDADRILRLRRLATQPLDTPDGDAILVADVLDILDDKGGPDELDRLRVTVQRVRQSCHEGTLAECGDDWESGYTQACSDILAIVKAATSEPCACTHSPAFHHPGHCCLAGAEMTPQCHPDAWGTDGGRHE